MTIDSGFDQLHYAHLDDVAHPDPCTPPSEHVGFQVEVDRLAAALLCEYCDGDDDVEFVAGAEDDDPDSPMCAPCRALYSVEEL